MLGSKSSVFLPAPAPASPTVSCLVYILLEICQSSRWGGGEIREGGWKNRFPPLGQGWRGAAWYHPSLPPLQPLLPGLLKSLVPRVEIKPLTSLLVNSEGHHRPSSRCYQILGIGMMCVFFFFFSPFELKGISAALHTIPFMASVC